MARAWTTKDVEYLRRVYPDKGPLQVARALGRTRKAVVSYASKIGLTRAPGFRDAVVLKSAATREEETLPYCPPDRYPPYEPGPRCVWRRRALKYIYRLQAGLVTE